MKKQQMKKNTVRTTLILLCVLIAGIGLILYKKNSLHPYSSVEKTQEKLSVIASIKTDEKTISELVYANTPFEALTVLAAKNQLSLKTKTYDFGIFVEAIGNYPMTKEKVWIYSVNGKSGDVAADRYMLQTGDQVTWEYTAPIY